MWHSVGMRMHITLDDDLVAELDERVGPRGRSRFIVECLRAALDDERRWDSFVSAIGSIPDTGHDWDDDPAAWVHAQRRAKVREVR